jgi:hypothetical protein
VERAAELAQALDGRIVVADVAAPKPLPSEPGSSPTLNQTSSDASSLGGTCQRCSHVSKLPRISPSRLTSSNLYATVASRFRSGPAGGIDLTSTLIRFDWSREIDQPPA